MPNRLVEIKVCQFIVISPYLYKEAHPVRSASIVHT